MLLVRSYAVSGRRRYPQMSDRLPGALFWRRHRVAWRRPDQPAQRGVAVATEPERLGVLALVVADLRQQLVRRRIDCRHGPVHDLPGQLAAERRRQRLGAGPREHPEIALAKIRRKHRLEIVGDDE